MVAGQELELDGVEAEDAREDDARGPLLAEDRASLLEAAEHGRPNGRNDEFTAKDVTWILAHAPSETIVLKPTPAVASSPSAQRSLSV
jgi:hypothetical protein